MPRVTSAHRCQVEVARYGLAALGLRDLELNFQRDTSERTLAGMQQFCDWIRPLIGS